MANRYLFVGGGIDTAQAISGVSFGTGSTEFHSAYADHSVRVTASTGECRYVFEKPADLTADGAVTGETLWIRISLGHTSSGGSGQLEFALANAAGQMLVGGKSNGNSHDVIPVKNTGTPSAPVWTNIGTTNMYCFPAQYIDVKVTLGSPHSVQFYYNDVLVASDTVSMDGITDISMLRAFGGNMGTAFSEILATVGIPTIGGHVFYRNPNAAGDTSTVASGAYTDIDEPGYSDTDVVTATASGQKALYNLADIPAQAANVSMGPVKVVTRARYNTSPAFMKHLKKVGGTEVATSSVALSAGYAFYPKYYTDLTLANWNAAQFGFEASDA